MRILVADDSPASWVVTRHLLRVLGHEAQRLEADGAAGGGYQLAMLDDHLLEDEDLARRIRAHNPELVLVTMGAESRPTGMPHLTKPICLGDLKQLLDQLFTSRPE